MDILKLIHNTTNNYLLLVAQLDKKPLDTIRQSTNNQPWSMLDILEHLLIVEEKRIGNLKNALAQTNKNTDIKHNSFDLKELHQKASNRERKVDAPSYSVPKGMLQTTADFKIRFVNIRKQMSDLVQQYPKDQLENTFLNHTSVGMMNIIEWLIYLCGHSEKHLKQIEEILQIQAEQN